MDQIDYNDFTHYARIEMQRKTIVIKLIIFTNQVNCVQNYPNRIYIILYKDAILSLTCFAYRFIEIYFSTHIHMYTQKKNSVLL